METSLQEKPPVEAGLPAAPVPDMQEIDGEILPLIKASDAIVVINSQAEYDAADDLIARINKARSKAKLFVETFFKPHKKRIDIVKQGLLDDEKKYLALKDAPLAEAREQKLAMMADYVKRIQAENARLQKEADDRQKKEQDLRDRQEIAAVEQQATDLGFKVEIVNSPETGLIRAICVTGPGGAREMQKPGYLEAIRQAVAKDAEKKRLAQIEKERLAKVDELLAEGKTAEAEQVIAAPVPPPPPPAPVPPPPVFAPPAASTFVPSYAVPKAKSVGTRKNWKWRPAGTTPQEQRAAFDKFFEEAIKNPAFREYCTWDADAIQALAKRKEDQAYLPGCEFYNDEITANARSK